MDLGAAIFMVGEFCTFLGDLKIKLEALEASNGVSAKAKPERKVKKAKKPGKVSAFNLFIKEAILAGNSAYTPKEKMNEAVAKWKLFNDKEKVAYAESMKEVLDTLNTDKAAAWLAMDNPAAVEALEAVEPLPTATANAIATAEKKKSKKKRELEAVSPKGETPATAGKEGGEKKKKKKKKKDVQPAAEE